MCKITEWDDTLDQYSIGISIALVPTYNYIRLIMNVGSFFFHFTYTYTTLSKTNSETFLFEVLLCFRLKRSPRSCSLFVHLLFEYNYIMMRHIAFFAFLPSSSLKCGTKTPHVSVGNTGYWGETASEGMREVYDSLVPVYTAV